MKLRLLSLAAVMALAVSLLTAAPAAAAIAVDSIKFPGDLSEFYSPFAGPASVKFIVNGNGADATYSLRSDRRETPPSIPRTSWSMPTIPTGSRRRRSTGRRVGQQPEDVPGRRVSQRSLVDVESFQLLPRLVTITGASPNPFLPWIDDGIKDETYERALQTLLRLTPTLTRVYRPTATGSAAGRSCSMTTRMSGPAAGTRTRGTGGRRRRRGRPETSRRANYFVKVPQGTSDVVEAVEATQGHDRAHVPANATLQKERQRLPPHRSRDVVSARWQLLRHERRDRPVPVDHLPDAKFTIYWRWNLPSAADREGSWMFVPISGDICNGRKGHTKTDSTARAGMTSGQVRCRLDTGEDHVQPPGRLLALHGPLRERSP